MKKLFFCFQPLFYLLTIVLLASCSDNKNKETVTGNGNYSIKTYQVDTSGWGYDIYQNEKVIIHQPYIPSINRNQHFKTKAGAIKTAELVIKKLNDKVFPPSLSRKEVDSLIK